MRRTGSLPSLSVRDTRGSGLEDRGSHISPVNGSGRMAAVLILPNFVTGSQTTSEDIRTVWTLAIEIPCSTNAKEKPGMISPVIIDYLLFVRYQHEKNNDIHKDENIF